MGEERWFCRSAEEWNALTERLKQMPCPHCKVVGALIRHGYLRGYDDSSPQRQTIRAADCHLSDRTWQRIWKRFDRGQSKIRTALSGCCPPPELPPEPGQRPAAHVLAHLHAAFPDALCPITAFQHTLRTFFV